MKLASKKFNREESNGKQKITLSVNSRVYSRYKRHCEKNALMLSKKVELFMQDELKKGVTPLDRGIKLKGRVL